MRRYTTANSTMLEFVRAGIRSALYFDASKTPATYLIEFAGRDYVFAADFEYQEDGNLINVYEPLPAAIARELVSDSFAREFVRKSSGGENMSNSVSWARLCRVVARPTDKIAQITLLAHSINERAKILTARQLTHFNDGKLMMHDTVDDVLQRDVLRRRGLRELGPYMKQHFGPSSSTTPQDVLRLLRSSVLVDRSDIGSFSELASSRDHGPVPVHRDRIFVVGPTTSTWSIQCFDCNSLEPRQALSKMKPQHRASLAYDRWFRWAVPALLEIVDRYATTPASCTAIAARLVALARSDRDIVDMYVGPHSKHVHKTAAKDFVAAVRSVLSKFINPSSGNNLAVKQGDTGIPSEEVDANVGDFAAILASEYEEGDRLQVGREYVAFNKATAMREAWCLEQLRTIYTKA